jgi:NADP-dependent 3-hydroxy acid dehydrogenase YdfG
MRLKGAVAVVTGASAGIGEATAVALAQRGAKVVLAARRLERLESTAERITRAGGTALAVPCDVTDHRELQTLRGVVLEAFGPVDVLVNNAGVPGGGDLVELDYEQIRRVVEVDVLGVMFGTRAFLPGMLARGHGHVLNVASLAGRFVAPGASTYTASKHAVVAFSEALNMTTAREGVFVTAVNPGFVPTEGFSGGGPRVLRVTLEEVSDAIVRAIQDGTAPLIDIPGWTRWARLVPAPLYRAVAGWAAVRYRDRAREGGIRPSR